MSLLANFATLSAQARHPYSNLQKQKRPKTYWGHMGPILFCTVPTYDSAENQTRDLPADTDA